MDKTNLSDLTGSKVGAIYWLLIKPNHLELKFPKCEIQLISFHKTHLDNNSKKNSNLNIY